MTIYSDPNNRPVPSRIDLGLDGQTEPKTIIPAELMGQVGVSAFWRQTEPQVATLQRQYHNVADAFSTLRKELDRIQRDQRMSATGKLNAQDQARAAAKSSLETAIRTLEAGADALIAFCGEKARPTVAGYANTHLLAELQEQRAWSRIEQQLSSVSENQLIVETLKIAKGAAATRDLATLRAICRSERQTDVPNTTDPAGIGVGAG